MKKNSVYCSDACPFCQRAYQLLEREGIPFQKKHVKNQQDWNDLFEKTGRSTVPQVFINGTHVGGFDDLSAAQQSGRLDAILNG